MSMLGAIVWRNLGGLPLALLAAMLVAGVIGWLYRPAGAPGAARTLFLALLRISVAVALCTALLKPVLVRQKQIPAEGSLLVLVDRSASMSAVDDARSPAQRIALAAAIGVIEHRPRSESADRVALQVRQLNRLLSDCTTAYSEMEYATVAGRNVTAARQQVDELKRQIVELIHRIEQETGKPGTHPRLVAGANQLATVQEQNRLPTWIADCRNRAALLFSIAQSIQQEMDSELYHTSDTAREAADRANHLSRLQIVEELLTDSRNGLVAKLAGRLPVICRTLERRPQDIPLSAAPNRAPRLNISATAHRSNLAEAVAGNLDLQPVHSLRAIVVFGDGRNSLSERYPSLAPEAPLYAVPIAPNGAIHDLSVRPTSWPSRALPGEVLTVRVLVRSIAMRGGTYPITCQLGSQKQEKQVSVTDDRDTLVEFNIAPLDMGEVDLSVEIPLQPGESFARNNRCSRQIKVDPREMKIALLARDTRAASMLSIPGVKLETKTVAQQATRLPLLDDEISSYDLLVLNDLPASAISASQWSRIERMVRHDARTLVLIGGPSDFPLSWIEHPAAQALLPFEPASKPVWKTARSGTPGFRYEPTAEFLERTGNADELLRWSKTWPEYKQMLQVAQLRSGVSVLLQEAQSRWPVVMEMRLGAGRVVLVASGDAPLASDSTPWLRLIRSISEDPLELDSRGYALDVSRPQIEPGDATKVRIQTPPDVPDSPTLRVYREGQLVSQDGLVEASPGSGRYVTSIRPKDSGEYDLRLSVDGEEVEDLQEQLHVVATDENELADISGDERSLRRLADASGGELVAIDQLSMLAEQLKATSNPRTAVAEWSLWDSPWLFGFVLACLSLEWSLRKRRGLA